MKNEKSKITLDPLVRQFADIVEQRGLTLRDLQRLTGQANSYFCGVLHGRNIPRTHLMCRWLDALGYQVKVVKGRRRKK